MLQKGVKNITKLQKCCRDYCTIKKNAVTLHQHNRLVVVKRLGCYMDATSGLRPAKGFMSNYSFQVLVIISIGGLDYGLVETFVFNASPRGPPGSPPRSPIGRSTLRPYERGKFNVAGRDAACRVISQAVGTAPLLPLQGAGGARGWG